MTFPLTVLFMWLVFWRPQEWLFPWMYGWPFLDIITYGAVVSFVLEAGQKKMSFPRTPAITLAAGLFVASIMSHVVHGYFQGVTDTVPETFNLCFFLVLLIVICSSIQRYRWLLAVILLGSIVMGVHAIMQEKIGAGYAGLLPLHYRRPDGEVITQSRFFGIFDDPNDLGQFLATCIPLAFAVPKRLTVVTLILSASVLWVLTMGMLTTHSRGTLVGVIATIVCMGYLRLPVRWLPSVAGLALIIGLVVCGAGGAALLDDSAHDRVVFWGEANQYFKSNLLFGGGYRMFEDFTGTGRAAHNAFVLCYSELGLFGYWFWSNLISLGLIGCWRTRVVFKSPKTSEQAYLKRVAGLSIAAMVGFASSSYFLSRAFQFPLFFLLALLASIPIIAQDHLPEGHPPLVNWRKDVLVTGTLSCLGSVVYIYISILLLNKQYGG